MTIRRWIYLICASLGAVAAGAQDASKGIDKISAYAGTWKIETENFKTPYSKPGKESRTLKNDCWRSGPFYACDQIVDGESGALIVFTYNAKDDTYNSYAVPAGGGAANSGALIIKGNVWTFPWEEKSDDGKTTYFQVVNLFTSPGAIEYRREFSDDKTHWTKMGQGIEKKLK